VVTCEAPTRKTTVYLPDDTERRMRRAAKRLGISRAEITRAALEEYLERSERRGVLPPSVGMGENSATTAADYEERLARSWGRR
jgi:Arc/MetJ-type ribon-helix-helix transcriptional regulator